MYNTAVSSCVGLFCGSFCIAGESPLGNKFTKILCLFLSVNDFGLGSVVGLRNFSRMLIWMSGLTAAFS